LVCPTFRCSQSKDAFPDTTCIHFDAATTFHEINNKCSKGQVCKPEISNSDTSCTASPTLKDDLASCTAGTECRSGTCTEKVCTPIDNGLACETNNQCKVGSYCTLVETKKVCVIQKDIGQPCTDDKSCLNTFLCNNSACTLPFSLKDGDAADRPVFCKSGDYDGQNGQPGVCITTTLTSPPKCSAEQTTCSYSYGAKTLIKNCDCNFTDGLKYCPLGSDQQAYKDYVSGYTDYYKNNAATKHVVYKNNFGYSLEKLKWNSVYYPRLMNADKCTTLAFTSSNLVKISIAAFLSLLVLLI